MSSGPPPLKKPRATLQQAGQFVKGIFHLPPSQPLPSNLAGPSAEPTQNQPPESAQIQGALPPTGSPAGLLRGVKRAVESAWPRLGNALRTLQQSSDLFPPVKPAVNGLLACIDILEAASQGKEEYNELASSLATLLEDLAEHLRESRSIPMFKFVSSTISEIQQQIDLINLEKTRLGPQRILEAQKSIDDLNRCHRRIEFLFRQLQNYAALSIWRLTDEQRSNAHLESMRPAKNAHYNSAMAAVVRRRQCTPNTRQAVLESLRAWKNDPNGAKVYWMNGMAGTGKTTIASTFCSELEATHQLTASFFCSRELPDCREAARIVPTIAYQLARFSLSFQSVLCETLRKDPDVSTRSVEVQFEKLIKEPLLRVKQMIKVDAVVVIDALDECVDNVNARLFLAAFCRFAVALPLRCFVTCRPDQGLLKKLLSWNQGPRILFHLHDIEQSVVRGDIEVYLSAELEGLSADHIRQLAERSGKLFIFAATVVRYVKPDNELDIWYDRLETLLRAEWSPGSKAYSYVDTLYSTILSAALSHDELDPADVEIMKQVLYTVICAKEPMTVETLAGVLGVSINKLVRVVDPLRSVLHVSEGNQLVSTLHASFPDYMLNRDRSKQFFCDTSTHHHFLVLRCFDVMKKSLRFNICNLESSYLLDENVLDLAARVDEAVSSHLFYACSHWADHLCEAGAEEGLVAPLDDFFSNGVLFWLEVMSLKKCIGVGITMLDKVQKWSQERNAPSTVCRFVQDADKFARLVGICRSTPHMYVSVLALWDRETPVWISHGMRMQGVMQLGRALQSNKTSGLLATLDNPGTLRSVAVSLDGSRIVSNYKSRFIVWDAYTGNRIFSPRTGHTDSVQCVAISPNGHTIASSSRDRTIYIWDAKTIGIIAGPLKGHGGSVNSVAFSPDGARVASGSDDCSIRIWDTQTGLMLLGPLEGHTGPIRSIAFSPDGGRVASGSDDRTIRVWNAQTGHTLPSPSGGHKGSVKSVGFSPDSARIASGSSDSTIRIWDAQNGDLLVGPFCEHSEVCSVTFSFNGARIISGLFDGTISMWDAHDGSALASPFDAHLCPIHSIAFSHDGTRFISGSEDCAIRIWDWNAASLRADEPDPEPPSVISVTFQPNSSSIASGFNSGTVRIWDMQTGDLNAHLQITHTYVDSIAFSPNGAHVALGSHEGKIEIWDVKNGGILFGPLRGHTRSVYSLTFSLDGERIVSGSIDRTIILWDVHTGNILSGPLKGHSGPVRSVVFSPDAARVASGSADRTVRIWDAQTGEMLLELRGHIDDVHSVRFSPDGGRLVSGSWDCAICIWDAHNGRLLARPSGHKNRVNSVAFSPDGGRIVSGSDDHTIRIWDAQTGRALAGPFTGHTDSVLSVAFSPDGSRVISGSYDGRIFIWVLHDSDYDTSNVASSWAIHNDGWIVGRDSARLLWLPPALRTPPQEEPIVIHNRGPFGFNPDTGAVGKRWATCFSG